SNSSIPADTSFLFVDSSNNPIANGVYTFYIDATTTQVEMSTANEIISSPSQFPIASITWTSPSLVLPLTDLRLFGTTANHNLRYETLGGLTLGLATGNRSYSLVYDGNRIRTIVITGDTSNIGYESPVTEYSTIPAPSGPYTITLSVLPQNQSTFPSPMPSIPGFTLVTGSPS